MSTDRPTYDPSPEVLRILARRYERKFIHPADRLPGQDRYEVIMPPPDQLARAVAAGVMFTESRALDHDGWVSAARQATSALTVREVGDAFLASLTSGRMDLRSAMASYAFTHNLPEHSFTRWHNRSCAICGIRPSRRSGEAHDLNSWNQCRFTWGGWLDDLEYAAFDLEQFARAPRLDPTGSDIALGQQIIDYLRQLSPKTTATQAARVMTMSVGTKSQREVLIDILGVCGILHSPGYPGYNDAFVQHTQTVDGPGNRSDAVTYPTYWWRAAGGINASALAKFLPQLT